MAIQDIVKSIIDEANEKAEKIISEYQEKAKKLISEKKLELEKKKEVEIKKIDEEANNYKMRKLQIAELEARKKILEAKQKLIEKVFENVKEKFYKMPKNEYLNFIKNKIIKYTNTGEEEIIIGTDDKNIITSDFIENLTKELKEKL